MALIVFILFYFVLFFLYCLTKTGFTALHYAVTQGHVLCVKELVAAGADPNVANLSGTYPLV